MITYICHNKNDKTGENLPCTNNRCETSICPSCGGRSDAISDIFWCPECQVPIYEKNCPVCGQEGKKLTSDVRPVFPEERLLLEIILEKPFAFEKDSVWNGNGNNYFVNGKKIKFSVKDLKNKDADAIRKQYEELKAQNTYQYFEKQMERFILCNKERYNRIVEEAKRDLGLFKKAMPRIKENPRLYQCVQNYYESNNKILPVIITGSNTSLSQAFLLALHRTLSMNGLLNAMPETNYKAAVNVIERWENEFPDTFEKLKKEIDCPINIFIEQLQNYNIESYEKFEKIYPKLTAGSYFNPFIGFDVIDLYEEAVKGLKSQGYTGIYVIYDEFSKYLEANITDASVSDTKMLQDFAEKCNRSGELQLHLMLISHKEIANYIDKLPKQKVDGWRGVSERFKHIHLNNNFTQTYEIVESAIHKKKDLWEEFCEEYEANDDKILFEEYEVIYEDLREVISLFMRGYTRPEAVKGLLGLAAVGNARKHLGARTLKATAIGQWNGALDSSGDERAREAEETISRESDKEYFDYRR